MAIRSALTERFGLEYPVVLAPTGDVSGGRGDFDTAMVWASEAVDLISDVAPAAQLLRRIGAEAEECLRRGSEFLSNARPTSST